MSLDTRFALIAKPTDPLCAPQVFHDVGGLARCIHRRRGDASLRMIEAPIHVRDQEAPLDGVSIWRIDQSADRADFLGWAYLDGAGRRALEAALNAACPDVPTVGLRGAA